MKRIPCSNNSITRNDHSSLPKSRDAAVGPRPEVGHTVEVRINDLLANGQGVGRIDGVVVFVWGPLPGELARVRISEVKARYVVAQMLELLESSPDRVEPFCGVFGVCGGCQVQHLAYPAQLAWKQSVVKAALERIGSLEVPDVAFPIGMDEPRAYRNKMALVVEHRGGEVELGFYEARSHDLVPITTCPIVEEPLQRDITALRACLTQPEGRALFADVRHLNIRRAHKNGQGVAALTTERLSPAVARGAEYLREQCKDLVGVSNSFDLAGENVILGKRNQLVAGEAQIEEQLNDLRFRVSVQSFFQVNSRMVEQIFAVLATLVQPNMRILDLYCGAGTFAIMFAKHGAYVLGFEENVRAIEEAHENAALNGVAERATFTAGRVEVLLREKRGRNALAISQVVFLDPPRKGCEETMLRALLESRVNEIWYLSCNPATLARDAAILAQGGFSIDLVQPFDMFPQTGHIEVLMRLRRTQVSAIASS